MKKNEYKCKACYGTGIAYNIMTKKRVPCKHCKGKKFLTKERINFLGLEEFYFDKEKII